MHVTNENQLVTSDGRRYSHYDCGVVVALSLALDAGAPPDETVAQMENWYIRDGDSPVDGTGLKSNADWLRSEGLDAVPFNGNMDVVDQFLDKGWQLELAIYSNAFGAPGGTIPHFIRVCWKVDANTYHVMQPVGGYEANYSRVALVHSSQNAGVVVMHDYRDHPPATTSVINQPPTLVIGQTSGGITMLDDHTAMAILGLAYGVAETMKDQPDKTATPYRADILAANLQRLEELKAGRMDMQWLVNDIIKGVSGR